MLPAWQAALYMIPLVLLTMFALAGYLVVRALFGYNLYETLILFQAGAPPGIYISGLAFIFTIFLWSLLLALVALFTRSRKTA